MDIPSRFVTKAELYTFVTSSNKRNAEGNSNTVQYSGQREANQQKYQSLASGKTNYLSSNTANGISSECVSSRKKYERRIEQVLIQSSRIDRFIKGPPEDLKTHNDNCDNCQNSSLNPQRNNVIHISRCPKKPTIPGATQGEMNGRTDHETMFASVKYLAPHAKFSDHFTRAIQHMNLEDRGGISGSNHDAMDQSHNSASLDLLPTKYSTESPLKRPQTNCSNCKNLIEEINQERVKLKKLEKLISQKEYEAIQLRDSLERNENAILKSFEDFRRINDLEASLMKKNLDFFLEAQLQNFTRSDDFLRNRVAALTQENVQLRDHITALKSQREEFTARYLRAECQLARATDRERELGRVINQLKRGIIQCPAALNLGILCPAQFRPLLDRQWKSEDNMKSLDFTDGDRKNLPSNFCEISVKEKENSKLSDTILMLKEELLRTKEIVEHSREEFEIERNRWQEEKIKVLNYQRFLQTNYLVMLNKQNFNIQEVDLGQKLSVIEEEDQTL